MIRTLFPFFLFTGELFTAFLFGLNAEGQYILKNLVLISAGIVIGAASRGRALISDPLAAGQAVETEKKNIEREQAAMSGQKANIRRKGRFCLPPIPQITTSRISGLGFGGGAKANLIGKNR